MRPQRPDEVGVASRVGAKLMIDVEDVEPKSPRLRQVHEEVQ